MVPIAPAPDPRRVPLAVSRRGDGATARALARGTRTPRSATQARAEDSRRHHGRESLHRFRRGLRPRLGRGDRSPHGLGGGGRDAGRLSGAGGAGSCSCDGFVHCRAHSDDASRRCHAGTGTRARRPRRLADSSRHGRAPPAALGHRPSPLRRQSAGGRRLVTRSRRLRPARRSSRQRRPEADDQRPLRRRRRRDPVARVTLRSASNARTSSATVTS